ncbi:unnamed protein product [Ceutorhynchus assimilis]|uniref:Uncharacterized protein n=1 Tax=Ceutorhynchus assimilis TaxID=467358 RepID=A0A9N9MSV1_9CUCU|nr:unnamed protein product [Ceutorhynchus assimilis]
MFLSNIVFVIGTLLITSSGKLLLENESENLLYKSLSDILPKFEAADYALTNVDLTGQSIPKVSINFNVDIKIFIKDCPKIALFDIRDSENSNTILNYFEKINCGTSTIIVIITNHSNSQYKSLDDYIFYILEEKLDFKQLGQVSSPKTDTIRIMYRNLPPFANPQTSNGLDEIILRLILKRLKLKNTIEFENELTPIGKNASTGNYTNVPLLLLQYGLVDVVAGGFHPSENDMFKDFQYSIVYATDTLNLIAPKSKVKSIGKRVMHIYSWKLSITSAVVFLLVVFFIEHFYKTPSVFIIIMWFYQMLLDGAVNNIQKKCTFLLPMSFILMANLISATAFKNTLTLIYFSKEYEPEIHSYEDITQSGLNIYVRHLTAIKDYKELTEKLDICQDLSECLQRIAYQRDCLLLYQKIPVLYSIPRYYTDNQTREPLLYVGTSFQQVPYQIYFRLNLPAFKEINRLLIHIYEAGIIVAETEWKIFLYRWRLSLGQKISSRVLNMIQLEFVFVFWLVGIILATLTLCGEVYIYNHFRN